MTLQQVPIHTTVNGERHNAAATRLYGGWLVLARMGCLALIVLTIGLFFAAIPRYFAYLDTLCTTASCIGQEQLTPNDLQRLQALGLSLDFYATYYVTVVILFALVYFLVSAVIFWRKSDDRMALLTVVFLATFPVAYANGISTPQPPVWQVPLLFLSFLGSVCISLFLYVFPDGRFVPRWTRWIGLVAIVYWSFSTFFPLASFNPFVLIPGLDTLTFFSLVGGGVVVQIYRYRRVSNPVQRQQTKWVIYGLLLGFTGMLGLLLSSFPNGSLASLIILAALACFQLLIPLSIGFAILHSRLWDIDRVINRTLVYGILTTILVLVYAGLIIALQALLRSIINQTSNVAIVASTLAIAALFQPLRQRIQRIVDHRFYRSKYDAAKIVDAFSSTLRNEVDLDQLRDHLLAVVQETMQPAHVSLWLRKPDQDGKRSSGKLNTLVSHSEE